jgi:hypothetical protein
MRLAARTITLSLLIFLSETAFADFLTGKVLKITDGLPGFRGWVLFLIVFSGLKI